MSDFEEKDLNPTPEVSENSEEEFSSIFSDPAEHRRIEVKKKKLLPKIIAAVLAVCVLIGGTVAVIKLIPVLEDENASSLLNEITVKDLQTDDISSVSVTNTIGTTVFYSKTTTEDDVESIDWYIKSIGASLTNSSKISDVVESVCAITSSRKITEKTAEECGLENSKLTAEVTPKEGDKYTVILGSKSPDNTGYYLKLSASDDIYIVSDEVYEALQFELLDFADTSNIPPFTNEDGELDEYFSNGQLTKLDRMLLSGKNHPEGLDIVLNDDESISEYLGYLVKAPSERIAQNTDALILLYQSGVEVTGAYSYDVSSASLKKFGLNDPDLVIKAFVGKKSLTYKFALQEDGNYAAVYDESKLIHKVEPTALEGIIELETADYYSGWIFYTSINDISNLTFKTADKSYAFGIKKNEVDEDSDEEQEDYTITYNGKKLVASNFQYLYQYYLSMRCEDFTSEQVASNPEITIELTFNKGGKSVIEFTKISATKYQVDVDGIVMGKVTASSVNKAIKYTEKVANGETISEIA